MLFYADFRLHIERIVKIVIKMKENICYTISIQNNHFITIYIFSLLRYKNIPDIIILGLIIIDVY